MSICPVCKSALDDAAAAGGVCPKCGLALPASPAARSPGELAPTLEAPSSGQTPLGFGEEIGQRTQEHAGIVEMLKGAFALAGQGGQDDSARPSHTQETMALPKKPRSVMIAPRKLSAANREMITGTWSASGSNPAASIKIESKSFSGTKSSLVVNPRGIRTAKQTTATGTGADYELLQVIGTGGMGVVYSARQASVDRMVAVKMIKPQAAVDLERREKFLSEAVVTGDLDHPNIVPIYELGTDEHDALFYSMKHVRGTQWSDVIEKKSLAENLEILMKVADAVAFAHANGVVHRDLKPENVMLGDFGEVLVMDWGLALATSTFRHAEFVTSPESMGGTPCYMAPEMVTGPFELIGPECDIYLLGGLLFEIATHLRPHTGSTLEECLVAAASNTIQPTEESGELIEIAYRAMATDPADRYPNVQEFQAAIRDYHAHCESISLATRAEHELAQACKSDDYQGFAHSLFGFQEALALWDGNTRARLGVEEARLAYAQSAKKKDDFKLGISLLDAENPEHAGLRRELEAAQRERDARQKWLSRFKQIAAALVLIVFGVITVSLFVVAGAKNRETAAKEQAIQDKLAAERAEQAAEAAKREEEAQKLKAEAARAEALAAEEKARAAAEDERLQRIKAVEAEKKAKAEEERAVAAKQGEEYAAYVARIGMAAATVDENAFDAAESLLAACQSDLRNWEWGYLKRVCTRGVNFKSTGTVASVAFSPDGKWFVTAGEDGQAHVWDLDSGRQRRAIDQKVFLHAVAVSPDGRLVATAGRDGQVRIARAADGTSIQTLRGHADRALGVAFSPRDGRWLLTCSRDKTARVWDAASGDQVAVLNGHTWWVWSAAFSADENQIVTAGQDGKVIVWSFDPRSKKPAIARKVFLGHDGPVLAAAFSPDGRQVASAGYDKRVLVWRPDKISDVPLKQLVATSEPISPQAARSFEGHAGPIRSVAFSSDGQYLLSGADDNTVRIWDVMTGKPHSVLRGHSRPVQSCSFSPDGRHVLSGAQEGEIKLWNILDYKEVRAPEGRVLAGHDDAILSAAFSPDGRRIVTGSRDHTARVYDVQSGNCLRWLKEGHEFLASRAIFFSDGRLLLTAAGDDSVRIWDASSGSQLSVIEGTGRVSAVAVSADGKWIVTGKSEKHNGQGTPDVTAAGTNGEGEQGASPIALWALDAGGRSPRSHGLSNRRFGAGHRKTVTAVAIAPDGRWLFSGDDAGVGKLWDAATGNEMATLKGHAAGITDAWFPPIGQRLLTSSQDGSIMQWDVATGRALPSTLSQRDSSELPVTAMALSSDGHRVLTLAEDVKDARQGLVDTIIRLWDVERASVVFEVYRGPETFTSIAFADGDQAALAASTRRDAPGALGGSVVRRWNLQTRRETLGARGGPYLDFTGRHESVWSAIAAPDGAGILTVGGKGAALWDPRNADSAEVVFKPHGAISSASFSRDGKLVVSASTDRRAKIWNVETGRSELQLPAEHRGPITSATFSPTDDRLLLTASLDGTARIWDFRARRVLQTLSHERGGSAPAPIRAAIFSADGKKVLTASDDGTVGIWEAHNGQRTGTLQLGAPALCVASSPDGRHIMVGGANGKAVLFDAETGKPLLRYLGHTAAINQVAFSPDGRRVLSGSSDRLVKLWDVALPDASSALEGTGEADAAASEHEPPGGREILTLKHHDDAVTSVAFSPDGRAVLSAGLDGTAVLWLSDDWHAAPSEGKLTRANN